MLLQVIADKCDPPDAADACGNLRNAYGGQHLARAAGISRRSFWRHIEALQADGFLVQLSRGGYCNGRPYASLWGIPGARGALDAERVCRVVVRLVADGHGKRHRVTFADGEQLPLRGCEQLPDKSQTGGGTSASLTHPQCHGGTPPSPHSETPRREKVFGNSYVEEGGVPRRRRGIAIVDRDFRDTAALLRLLDRAVQAGLVEASEADRLRFVSLAEHAIARVAAQGGRVPNLFAYLLYRPLCWSWITAAEEDRARLRLSRHDHEWELME
jgi:hypothetical protein